MSTAREVKQEMIDHPDDWEIPLMEFVDEFRLSRDPGLVAEPFDLGHARFDALLASTVECLCDELSVDQPGWLTSVPGLDEPWFVSGVESLKAIALAESPVYFRCRNIFVLENFLSRV